MEGGWRPPRGMMLVTSHSIGCDWTGARLLRVESRLVPVASTRYKGTSYTRDGIEMGDLLGAQAGPHCLLAIDMPVKF